MENIQDIEITGLVENNDSYGLEEVQKHLLNRARDIYASESLSDDSREKMRLAADLMVKGSEIIDRILLN